MSRGTTYADDVPDPVTAPVRSDLGGGAAIAVVGSLGAVGVVAGLALASPAAAPTYWLVALWASWLAAVAWIVLSRRPSLAMAGLQVFFLLEVLAPATISVVEGRTMIAVYDVTAGTVGALQLSTLAQVAVLAGAITARAFAGTIGPTPVRLTVSARRLDRWAVALLAVGAAGMVAYVVTAGGDPSSLMVLFGSSKYGDFLRSAEGPVVKYFSALLGFAGVAIVVASLRLTGVTRRSALVPGAVMVVAAAMLVSGGGRWWLAIPAVASVLVWWRTTSSPWARRPRLVLAVGAALLVAVAVLVGGLRDQRDVKQVDVAAFVDKQLRGGVFGTTAVLVDTVPARYDHLGGSSYAELVTKPVPRALWDDKPEGAVKDLQRAFFRQELGASFAFYGELYANFGWLGTGLGCLAFGALLEAAWLRLARARTASALVLYAMAVPVLLQLFSRGYLAGLIAGVSGFVVATALVVHGLRRVEARPDPTVTAPAALATASRR
jgi:hypothetical protein